MTIEEKILNGVELTERELKACAIGEEFEWVDEIEGDDHRWQTEVKTIFKIGEQLYAINWMRGLTECQEHSFYNQPYKVERHEKVITVTTYNPIAE